MLNDRLKAAHTVRDAYMPLKLNAAAIARQALECAAVMSAQRSAAGLKIGAGSDAIASIARAGALFAEAEQLIARAHPELGELIRLAGLNRHFEYGYGSEDTVNPERRENPVSLVAKPIAA